MPQNNYTAEKNMDPMVAAKCIGIAAAIVIAIVLIIAAITNWTLFWILICLFAVLAFIVLFIAARGCMGPLLPLGMWSVGRDFRKKYGKRPAGEIVFYGASNFTYWKTLEEDMAPYCAQNHGFGGSMDKLLLGQADKFLYPYKPSVVFIQTGSNDNVSGLSLEQIMENKKRMYAVFHENLPETKFIVMSGLPLPGRTRHWEHINRLNQFLETYCAQVDYLEFINATPLMMTTDGSFRPDYFGKDGIHLNAKGHDVWTRAMKDKLAELGILPAGITK